VLGTYNFGKERDEPIPFDAHVRAWHNRYSPTFKPSFEASSNSMIDLHLAPYFGSRDLRSIDANDLLDYIKTKLDAGLAPATITTQLSIVRRVLGLAVRDGLIVRNPAERLGELMRRVERRVSEGVKQADAWGPEEVSKLLAAAHEHEPRFYPALLTLLSTGIRRGELLGLKWEDIDFESSRISIRRGFVCGQLTTPKNGKGRTVAMPPTLAETLFDLLAQRRQECLANGWADVPEWIFCTVRCKLKDGSMHQGGAPLEERNFNRAWQRIRRKAQKQGVRPLKLHTTRHTYASRALAAGKSLRWVAEQLGHSNPEFTLRTCAHLLPQEETDLSFADFGGPKRPYTAPPLDGDITDENTPAASGRGHLENLEHETGIEPATLTLARRCWG